jgi:hypothetical protein
MIFRALKIFYPASYSAQLKLWSKFVEYANNTTKTAKYGLQPITIFWINRMHACMHACMQARNFQSNSSKNAGC